MRLATCWAHIREFMINQCAQDTDDVNLAKGELPTKDELIERFDQKQFPASEELNGLQQAVNDFSLGVQGGIERNDPQIVAFLARYKTATGHVFFDDAGNPSKIAKKIVRRGAIDNETQFYLLKEILSDVEQTVLSESQTADAIKMIDRFEFGDVK